MVEQILKLDKEIVSEIILENRCYQRVTELCELGTRFPGTKGEKLAREYILKEIKSYGYTPKVEKFEHLGWKRGISEVKIVEPLERELLSISLAGAPSTGKDGIDGEILFLGNGTPGEFEQYKDQIKDRIVFVTSLAPLGQCTPPRQCHRRTKYGRAVEFGAKAFIFMNSQAGMLPQTGSTRQNMTGEIPAVTIPFEEGELLKNLISKGPVRVKLVVENETFTNQSGNIVAELPGKKGDEVVIIGAHYDCHDNSHGAQDNGTGVAILLELARIIKNTKIKLEKTIRFIFFGVEEMAAIGSSFYVKEHQDELDKIHLYINVDGLGSGGKIFDTQGFDDLSAYLLRIAKELNYQLKIPNPAFSGDALAFVFGGVPTAALKRSGSPGIFNFKGSINNEDRGWGHTSADTLDKIIPSSFYESAILAGRTLIRAANHNGPIAKYRCKKEVANILKHYGMDEVLYYMKWPTIPIESKY